MHLPKTRAGVAEGPDSPLLAPVTMAVLPLRSTGQASALQLFLPRTHSSARRTKVQMNQSGWEKRAAPSISGSFQEQLWMMGADPEVQAKERPLVFRKRKAHKVSGQSPRSKNGLPISWTEAISGTLGRPAGQGRRRGGGEGGRGRSCYCYFWPRVKADCKEASQGGKVHCWDLPLAKGAFLHFAKWRR